MQEAYCGRNQIRTDDMGLKSKLLIQWGNTSQLAEWLSTKSLQMINAGKAVEKREPSSTIGGNINWYSHYGEQYGGSLRN